MNKITYLICFVFMFYPKLNMPVFFTYKPVVLGFVFHLHV